MATSIVVQGMAERPLDIACSALAPQSDASPMTDSSFVCVGDEIDVSMQDGFLRGHGTQLVDGKLAATLCGVVERVNKLVSVRPMISRYTAELGDVVVGRVMDVANKRWKIDIGATQEATLQLSAVNLPGGVQRRRTAEDELNMRLLFEEGDLISAEVQSLFADGAVALQTRSFKYGKLTGGQLVRVQHNLIKRQKMHFTSLEAIGVNIIFGVNGQVWVAPYAPKPTPPPPQSHPQEAAEVPPAKPSPPATTQQRTAVCRAANAVRALSALKLQIHTGSVIAAVELARQEEVAPLHMLGPQFLSLLAAQTAQRRGSAA